MKKLLLLSALCAIAANLNGAASRTASTPWENYGSIYTGDTYKVVDPQISGALGVLLRAFRFKSAWGSPLAQDMGFENAVRLAAETGNFSSLDAFGKKHANEQVEGITLPEWIALAKKGHIPVFATGY
jgi:hypothetical protein